MSRLGSYRTTPPARHNGCRRPPLRRSQSCNNVSHGHHPIRRDHETAALQHLLAAGRDAANPHHNRLRRSHHGVVSEVRVRRVDGDNQFATERLRGSCGQVAQTIFEPAARHRRRGHQQDGCQSRCRDTHSAHGQTISTSSRCECQIPNWYNLNTLYTGSTGNHTVQTANPAQHVDRPVAPLGADG